MKMFDISFLYDLALKPLSKKILISTGTVGILYGIIKIYQKKKRELKRLSYPRDVVILHQFPRGPYAPSASPFVLKVETWLRMNNIKYQNEHGYTFGSKGRLPFITYNGEDIPDSDFIIEYLSSKLNKDLSKNHSPKDLGVARAFSKMTEESLFWVVVLNRYVYELNSALCGFPKPLLLYISTLWKPRTKAQGYGLHTKEEVYSIGKKDLKSLNDFLDGKKYLLGDEPCNEDSTIFGHICQIIYHERGPMHYFIKNECPNIVSYIENIKITVWPDWNSCIKRTK